MTTKGFSTAIVTDRIDDLAHRFGPLKLRWIAALLWLSNISWKVPTAFGRSSAGCRGLCGYVEAGAHSQALPGSAWFFREIASPNLTLFGWVTLFSEAALAVLLIAGLLPRITALLGMGMSAGIFLSVANHGGEWYWSYLLMAAIHLALLVMASDLRPHSPKVLGAVMAGYGLVVALAHIGAGLTGDGNKKWTVFATSTVSKDKDWFSDFGKNVFPGSILVGVILVALGVVVALGLLSSTASMARSVGLALVGLGTVMLLSYREDGTFIGLGSKATTACVVAALGLSLLSSSQRTQTPGSDKSH